ncbi:MAG: F0F1 ATP synthase subunit gamma [Pirellulaceae bacterium]
MPTLESLHRQIATAEDLGSVVTTMKTLAAVSIHQYERAADSLADYNRTIELGLQVILRSHPWRRLPVCGQPLSPSSQAGSMRHGAIVFGSDQGMCGQFNEQITAMAIQRNTIPPVAAWVVGQRVAPTLADAGWSIDQTFRIPTSVLEISDCVSDLLASVEQLRRTHDLTTVRIYSTTRSLAATYQPHERQLLPIDPDWLDDLQRRKWDSRCLPTYGGDPEKLMSLLVGQSLYVSLYRACAESLASENASRIAAMQAAEKNIDETLGDLNTAFKTKRQSAITEELLDVVIGFEALKKTRALSTYKFSD